MLLHLRIEDLALVDELTCEFGAGLNVLTGETGAGKSVILGALSLLMGQRADRSILRSGADRCVVEAVLTPPRDLPIAGVLEKVGADAGDGELILRRIIGASGSNRQFANGAAVPLGVLAELGEWLVDMHGPHDHQSLLRRQAQLDLLDGYAKGGGLRDACEAAWQGMREADRRIAALSGDGGEIGRTIDLLTFQAREIEGAGLKPGEDVDVAESFRRASHAERLLELAAEAAGILTEQDDSVADRLGQVVRILDELSRMDAPAGDLAAQSRDLAIAARELGSAIERYAGGLESDPETLRLLEQRLNLIESLRRKYGPTVEEILTFGLRARERLDELEGRDEEIRRLEAKKREFDAALRQRCEELSALRRAAALRVAKAVAADLARLGFAGASFAVALEPADPGARGADAVEFLFTPNTGEDARPLRAIASSGEVSRVMLALKAAFAEEDRVPVLLFDEIDVNVGGEVAHAVGETLQRIARRRQVLCITHLAQVACRADHHYRVGKTAAEGRSRTTIEKVTGEARVGEIARMLGGTRIASRAVDHARQLLDSGRGAGGW